RFPAEPPNNRHLFPVSRTPLGLSQNGRMKRLVTAWRSFCLWTQARFGDSRLVSALELLLGAAIVIGHNVFRVLPNEVPILFVLGLLSMRLRDGRWSAIGFKRPESWRRIVLIALGAAALRVGL